MIVINDSENKVIKENSVVTIGTFDGLHTGHIEIINQLKTKSIDLNLKSTVITFYPHPRTVVTNNFDQRLLTPLEEKKELFSELGIDYLFIISFTEDFSRKSYKDFFDEYLIEKVNTNYLVIGYDHKFGKDRDGDISKLRDYAKLKNIDVGVVGQKLKNGIEVSSTKIRSALHNGELELANSMLGRYYYFDGIVVEGAKRGRTLGYPTANLGLREDDKLVPKNGVYLVRVILHDTKYFGVANIGLRPTFNNSIEPITEVFILDFDEDIYGEKISVEFIQRIRDEKKFDSVRELEINIKNDVEFAKQTIKELNNN